jgi:uncharacterized membrane protein
MFMQHFYRVLDGGHAVWPFVVMAFGMAIFWIAVIVLVVWLVRRTTAQGPQSGGRTEAAASGSAAGPSAAAAPTAALETPIQILPRRYAAGELDRDEFLRRKEDLS